MAVDYGWQLPCYVAKELLILLVVTEEMRFRRAINFVTPTTNEWCILVSSFVVNDNSVKQNLLFLSTG